MNMASYQIAPPERFNFTQPDEWPKWIRRFERFRQASGLNEKPEEGQVNTLIYSMGDEADDILTSLGLSDEEKKKYDKVKEKLESHFVKRRNVIYERAKFNQRRQEEGESTDSFITALYCLVEHCEYGTLKQEMIRDRIVVGLRDASLSEKLQLDPDLTLDKAVAAARQRESVRKQQSVVRGDEGSSSIDAISTKPRKSSGEKQKRPPHQKMSPVPMAKTCSRCGRSPLHGRHQCPAINATCRKCTKKGHFQAMCRSGKTVGAVQADSSDVFLGAVKDHQSEGNTGSSPWNLTLSVNGKPVRFRIDTGADVTVIPEPTLKEFKEVRLQPSNKSLRGPGQCPLDVCGQFKGTLRHGAYQAEEQIFVVRGLQKALLGRPAIEALGLVLRVNAVNDKNREIIDRYPELFEGLGTMEGEYRIRLKENSKPFALSAPRRVALPLLPKVKAELERMERMDVISRVEEPTDWCAAMVVVPKTDGNVRICVDLTKLNENVLRERHILPSVEQTLAQLTGAKVFSKLDANSGFWQIKLARESSLLTTFITPFGRFCFNRLPFGITSAPEYYQRRMSDILTGLEGVVCMIDDVLVHGHTQEDHDRRLNAVLDRIKKAGVTLNKEKCEFSRCTVRFLGQIVDATGIRPDPEKVRAIQQMKQPSSVTEVRRFLGMTNQMSKFTSEMAEKAKPLRDLLSKKNQWSWGDKQQQAFDELKRELSSSPTLALYDPKRETIISADASSYGIGGVLLQKQPDQEWRPIAYASRALTSTEERYAQIEKEALAVTWTCECFSDYLLGMTFHIQTDHKPLVPLLGSKILDELPVRVQRFKMRLMRFKFTISHVAGKDLVTADALSRAPATSFTPDDEKFKQEVDAYVNLVLQNLPATEKRLEEIKKLQEEDEVCKQIKLYCRDGWPDRSLIKGAIKPYFPVVGELSVQDGLLMRGSRIVVPTSIRLSVLDKLHVGHQGITKCRERARQSVWWPGLSKQLEALVQNCAKCCKDKIQHAEPLITSPLPSLPWQKVATDLFERRGSKYLLIVDYFSRYIEFSKLTRETSSEIINHMKSIFARHGIPQQVMSDNGTQFSSLEFAKFADEYNFSSITSSPKYPQSNGEVERAVKTLKRVLKKAEDPYAALLAYRSTPLECGYSPAELLMNRRLRTTVPMIPTQLIPHVPDYSTLRQKEKEIKMRQKSNFDSRHKACDLEPLIPGEQVWVTDQQKQATVIQQTSPRSYQISTPSGTLRRNRRHLNPIPPEGPAREMELPDQATTPVTDHRLQTPDKDGQTRTRSGRIVVPPDRLDTSWK